LTSQLAASEARQSANVKQASSRIAQILSLRNVVRALPAIKTALSLCHSRLLVILTEVCLQTTSFSNTRLTSEQMICDPRIEQIEQLISSHLNDDAVLPKVRMIYLVVR